MQANHARSNAAAPALADQWDVAEHLAALSRGWLPDATPDRTLAQALTRAAECWPADRPASATPAEPLLYPLVYTERPRVTSQQFCEVTDAACEAQRAGTDVHVMGIPLGRSRPDGQTAGRLRRIADAWQQVGLPVRSAGPLAEHPGAAAGLARRARGCAFTGRREDLIDLLVSAAADAVGTSRVYLGAHVRPRRNLETLDCLPSLCRLYQPSPFADPPSRGKRRPAGSDSVWFLAFTLGLVDEPEILREREAVREQLRARIGRCWNTLRAADLTAHRAIDQQQHGRIQLRLTLPAGHTELPHPSSPILLPLFGSPTISPATRALVATIAAVTHRERLLVVDDVSPRFLYARYDLPRMRAGYTELARDHGYRVRFLSELPPAQLTATVEKLLARLRMRDLTVVAPRGVTSRSRGGLTGYDAVHLAVIAATLQNAEGCVLAVKGANLPSAQRLAAHLPVHALIVCTGTEDWPGSSVDPRQIRVEADPAALLPILVGTR